MKVTYFILMIIVIGSLLLIGCGGSARNVAQPGGFNVVREQTVERLYEPTWWMLNGRVDNNTLFVYGRAEHSSRRGSELLARDRAEAEIALFMNRAFTDGTDAFEHAIEGDENFRNFAMSARRNITEAKVRGIRITNRETVRISGLYHTFFELSLDAKIVQEVLDNAIENARQNVMNNEHQAMIDQIQSTSIRFGM
jgi:hypothetical protein